MRINEPRRNGFLHWGEKEHQGSPIACKLQRKKKSRSEHIALPCVERKTPIEFDANYEQDAK